MFKAFSYATLTLSSKTHKERLYKLDSLNCQLPIEIEVLM